MGVLEKIRLPIARDALGIGLVKVCAIPAVLGVSVILARNLGPSDYGVYAFALSLTSLVALALTGGLAQLVTREVAFSLHEATRSLLKGVIRSAAVWGLGSSLAALLGLWAVLSFISPDINRSLRMALLLAFLALPILALSPVWAGTLRGYGLAARSQYPSLLLAPLAQLAVVAVLMRFGLLGLQTAILSFLAANALAAVVGLYLMRATISGSLRGAAPEYRFAAWAKSSITFTGIALITYLSTQVGVLLLGFTSTTSDVAAFQIADRGAQLAILATGIIELVLAPHVARAHKMQDFERLQDMFRISRRVGGGVTLVVALPLMFAGTPIIHLIFGSDYVELSVQPLAIISAALAVRALLGPTTTFLSMTGNEKWTLAAHAVGLAVNIGLTLILSPKLGATGAAWAAAISIVVLYLWLAFLVKKLGISPFKISKT